MELLKLLQQQIEKQSVGTLTLGRRKGFREIFFDRDVMYLVGGEFSGKIALDNVLESTNLGERLDLSSLDAICQSTDLKRILLPQILFDQGIVGEEELEPLAQAQLRQEIVDLLARNSGSFHFQDGRVPESLLQCDDLHTQIPVTLADVLDELGEHNAELARYQQLVPSNEEIFVLTEKGMAHRQSGEQPFVEDRVLGMVDGFRDLRTIVGDSYFFEGVILRTLCHALEEGYIKKTLHPELKGISTSSLSKDEAERVLPLFKNAVRYGVDELAARERLAVIYERLGKIEDAVIQYNFIGDSLFQMRKPSKAIKAYQCALALRPGEALLTDKISKIYVGAAEKELEADNPEQAIQLFEGALKLHPSDTAIATRLADLRTERGELRELGELCENLISAARRSREPDAALGVLRRLVELQPTNLGHRKRLINLLLDFEFEEQAVTEMGALAAKYAERGHASKADELLAKAHRVQGRPGDSNALRSRIATSRVQRAPRTERLSGARVARAVVATVVLLFVVYQAWSGVAWWNIQVAHGQQVQKASGLEPITFGSPGIEDETAIRAELRRENPSLAALHSRELKFRALVDQYSAFTFRFPVSVLAAQAGEFKRWASTRAEILARHRKELKQSALETLKRDLETQGYIGDEHRGLLDQLLHLQPSDPTRALAETLKGREVDSGHRSAIDMRAEADRRLEAGDIDGAFAQFLELRRAFPSAKETREFPIPIRVLSFPSGAAVYEPGPGGETFLGRTPNVILRVNASTRTFINVGLDGFRSENGVRVAVPELLKAGEKTVSVALTRIPVAELRDVEIEIGAGRVAGVPTLSGDSLFWGTQDGALHWMDLLHDKRGSFPSGAEPVTLRGQPVVMRGRIYTRWSDGTIRVWELPETSFSRSSLRPRRGPVVIDPGPLPETDLVAVNTHSLVVFGLDDRIEQVTPTGLVTAYGADRVAGRLLPSALASHSIPGQLLVGSRDGVVRCITIGSHAFQEWAKDPPPRVAEDKTIRFLDAASGVAVVGDASEVRFLRRSPERAVTEEARSPIPTTKLQCLHRASGRFFQWSRTGGLLVRDVHSDGDPTLSPALTAELEKAHVALLTALPDLLVLTFPVPRSAGMPITRSRGSGSRTPRPEPTSVLFVHPGSLTPAWEYTAATPVTHVVGTRTWRAVCTKDRFVVFHRRESLVDAATPSE